MAENNLNGIGRQSGAPGSQQVNAEEMLAELVRLVESSGLAPEGSAPPAETVSEPKPKPAEMERVQSLEMRALHPSVEVWSSKPSETGVVRVDPPRAPEPDNSYSKDPNGIDLARGRRSGAWTFKASALVLACAAGIGSIFWLERVEQGPPKAGLLIAAAQSPTPVQPEGNLSVSTSSETGATLPRAVAQPAQGKVISPGDGPIDLNGRVSLDNPPPSADVGPTIVGVAQPTADASAGKPLAASVNAPAAAAPIAASPSMASQSLDPKPVPTISLPPDPTSLPPDPQMAMPAPSATNPGAAVQASDTPLPPVRPAPKAAIETAGVGQRSTPKLDLPTKLSNKSAAHVVVAKADANGPLVHAEAPSEPLRRTASVNPEKGAKTLKAVQQAPAEAQAPPSEQSAAPQPSPSPNPVVHAFNNAVGAVGALAGLIPFVPH